MKKVLSVLLSLALLFIASAPFSVFADPEARMLALSEHIADRLAESGFESGTANIDISQFNISNNGDYDFLCETVRYTGFKYPDLFYVNFNSFGYSIVQGKIISLRFSCRFENADIGSLKAEYEQLMAAAISDIRECKPTTDVGYVLAIHKYLVQNFEYDLNYEVRDAYSMLKKGVGVCEGYTMLFNALAGRFGIETSHSGSEEMNHTWSLVRVDGEWYHIDNTWDDPIYQKDESSDPTTGILLDRLSYDNFLKSDGDFLVESYQSKKHYGAKAYYECTSDLYGSYFWDYVKSAIFTFAENDYWYIDSDGVFKRRVTEGVVELADHDSRWFVYNDGKRTNSYYSSSYAALEFYGRNFYYNDCDRVYKYSLDDGTETVVFENADISLGNIYGLRRNGDVLSIEISTDPFTKGVIKTLTLEKEQGDVSVPGDFTGDGEVDSTDAVYLLRHVLFPADFPIEADGDIDRNGKVDSADAIYLLRHVLFPDDYPLLFTTD